MFASDGVTDGRWAPHGTTAVSPALRSARGSGPPPGPPVGVDDYGPPATEVRRSTALTSPPAHRERRRAPTAHCLRHDTRAGPCSGAYIMWVYNSGQATGTSIAYLLLSLSVRDGSPSARKLAIRCPSAQRQRRKARLRGRPTTSPPALRRTTRKRHPATAYSGCRPFAKRSGAATNPLECCEHKTYEQVEVHQQRAARSCPWCRQVTSLETTSRALEQCVSPNQS